MCGRFVSASPPEEIAEYFGAVFDPVAAGTDGDGDPYVPRYNVAPTLDVFVVFTDGTERRLDQYHWGLIPGFAQDVKIGARMINARAETVAVNNSFRSSFARRRCIVPADGFYEWQKVAGHTTKQPYYIHRRDDEPLAFAGLWAEWRGQVAGQPTVVRSTTIITTEANETMAPLHDRMPVILPRRSWDLWLDPEMTDVARVQPLLVPAPPTLLVVEPVGTEVGNARNEGPQLIVPIPADRVVGAAQGEQGTLL